MLDRKEGYREGLEKAKSIVATLQLSHSHSEAKHVLYLVKASIDQEIEKILMEELTKAKSYE